MPSTIELEFSRKYDRAEHAYPTELDMLAAMIDGLSESGASEGAGADFLTTFFLGSSVAAEVSGSSPNMSSE